MDLKKLKEIDYQGLAIQHCEKAAIALVGCMLVLFMLSAVKNYLASSSISPQDIKQLAEGIHNSYRNSQFDAKGQGIENPNLRGELAKLLGDVELDLAEYRWAQLYFKFVDFGGVFRDQPEILKPYSLIAVQSRGPTKLYATNDRGEFLFEDPSTRPKQEAKKPSKKEEDPAKKKATTPPKAVAKTGTPKGAMGRGGGMAGGAMSGGGAGGMESGMGMVGGGVGFGGDEMGGGMGGARSGRGNFGAGMGGDNLSQSLAQNNPAGHRRPRTSLGDDMAVGDEPVQKSAPGDSKKADTSKPENRKVHKLVVRGLRWAVVTALFPHAEQLKKYKEALHNDEAPEYLGFKVERRYLLSDGTFSAWARFDMKEDGMELKVMRLLPEHWEEEDRDLLAAKALFLGPLVMRVPYLEISGGWKGAVRKEALEAARKILGGATANQIATGGEGAGGEPEGAPDESGMENPNEGFVGVEVSSAGALGSAGFPGGQAGGPAGGPGRGGGAGRAGPGVPGGGRGMMAGGQGSAARGPAGAQQRSGGGNTSTAGKSATKAPVQTTKAETIMLRFVDYTVEPEHTYQYRIKVVVANPNYNHPWVVNDDISKDERLEGDWSDPSQPVLVEPDTSYYVLEKTKIPTEVEKIRPPEAKFEVHKWIADLADWQLKDFTVRPGETIGKRLSDHMAVTFDSEKKKTDVDFSTDELVLDVTGSTKSFNVDGVSFNETSPADVLIVDRLGELVSHNELVEKNNPVRKHREDSYKALLKDAIEPDKAKKGDAPPEANKRDDFDRVPTRRDQNKD